MFLCVLPMLANIDAGFTNGRVLYLSNEGTWWCSKGSKYPISYLWIPKPCYHNLECRIAQYYDISIWKFTQLFKKISSNIAGTFRFLSSVSSIFCLLIWTRTVSACSNFFNCLYSYDFSIPNSYHFCFRYWTLVFYYLML